MRTVEAVKNATSTSLLVEVNDRRAANNTLCGSCSRIVQGSITPGMPVPLPHLGQACEVPREPFLQVLMRQAQALQLRERGHLQGEVQQVLTGLQLKALQDGMGCEQHPAVMSGFLLCHQGPQHQLSGGELAKW